MENPIIEQKDRENDENGRYSDWFHDNLDENIEKYAGLNKAEKERLTDLYSHSYEMDIKFEEWCRQEYHFIANIPR